jgi:hypothetical protein
MSFICIFTIFGVNLAVSQCMSPKHNGPSLSFSLASFHPWDLDRKVGGCRDQINTALAKGFTSATLVPTIAVEYNPSNRKIKILPQSKALRDGELTRCLEVIWKSGMDIVYQPHLDSTETLSDTKEIHWRAAYDFDPTNGGYWESMFLEFEDFIKNKSKEISRGNRQVDVVIAAELEKSTTKYPAQWLKFAQKMRKRFEKMGIPGKKVRIGFNPNWDPKADPSLTECNDYNAFVEEMDFIAVSFYGDWRKLTNLGATWKDVTEKKNKILKSLIREKKLCRVDAFKSKPFSVGEFGVGRDFRHIEFDELPDLSEQCKWQEKRSQIYENLMDWAANDPSIQISPPLALTIWTVGKFDPVNIRGYSSSIPDPYIEHYIFKKYSAMRCGFPWTTKAGHNDSLMCGINCVVGLKADCTILAGGKCGYPGFMAESSFADITSWKDIIQIAAGDEHAVGLKKDGTVVAVGTLGNVSGGKLNVSSWKDIVQVATGEHFTIGLKKNGSVIAVRDKDWGKLNIGTWKDIIQVAVGDDYAVGLKKDGTVIAAASEGAERTVWKLPDGQQVELPLADTSYLNVGSWKNIVQVATGQYHTVGLKRNGTVVAVGISGSSALNVGSWIDIVQIVAGLEHTVGLKKDGTVVAAGDNVWGQMNVSSWKDIVQVAACWKSTLGLKKDGTVVMLLGGKTIHTPYDSPRIRKRRLDCRCAGS